MKKIVGLFLSFVMMLGVVACGDNKSNSDASDEQTTLTFWGHQNEAWNEAYREVAKKFEEENENIKINFEFFPYDQFESKVQTSLMSDGDGADIYELWGGWGIDFAPTGALAPITKDIQENIEANYYEPTYGSLMHEGALYGFPLEFNIEYGGMLINDTLMNEYGLKAPTTWEELRATALDATKMEGNTYITKGFDFVNWDSVPYIFSSMIMTQGASYMNEDGTFNFQTPEAKKALQELYDMVSIDKVTDLEGLTGGGELEGYQQLFAGNTAMVPRGPWTISEGEFSFGLEYGKDFEYVGMPWYGDTPSFAAETGWSIAVNGNTKEQEAAMKFVEFFSQEDILLDFNVACAQIPADKNVATDPEFVEKMEFAAPLVDILEYGHFIGYFNTDVYKEEINDMFVKLNSSTYTTVDEALAALEKSLNDKINK